MSMLGRRLGALEVKIRSIDAEGTADERRRAAWDEHRAMLEELERAHAQRRATLWRQLAATMDPEHVALAVEAVRLRASGDRHPDRGARHLGVIVESMLSWAAAGFFAFRLALPADVGRVYLEHAVWPAAQCAACLLPVPYRPQPLPSMPPERWFFTRCPECGGEVRQRGAGIRRRA